MNRVRTLPAHTPVPAHDGRMTNGVTMTECAIHTVQLQEGHFTAIVHSRPGSDISAVAYLDEEEVEAHITLLRNSVEDARLLDAGKAPIHAAPTLVRQ